MREDERDSQRTTDPPGAVSNQNQEVGPSALRDDETHPEPRTAGRRRDERPEGHDKRANGQDVDAPAHQEDR